MPKTKKSSGTRGRTVSKPKDSDTLLTVDLSMGCTGWAVFVGSSLIDHGHFSPKRKDLGEAAFALIDEISRILKIYEGVGVDGICYEHAFRQKGAASEQFATLETALRMVAFREGIPWYRVGASALKKAVTGYGRAEKKDIIAEVERRYGLGLDPARENPDGDIADAIGIWIAVRGA